VDCEKFDRIVLDELYGELDELTSAAAKRHKEHCARCASIDAELQATREVGVLELFEPPDGMYERILQAERDTTRGLPLRKRLGRAVSILAGYAMRPQLAMAALLLLMIGSSLLFLRTQPGDHDHVSVTERGVPESESDPVTVVKKADSPSVLPHAAAHASARTDDSAARVLRAGAEPKPDPALAAEPKSAASANADGLTGPDTDPDTVADGDTAYDAAMAAYRDGRYSEAEQRFAEVANRGGNRAASAALYAAQARRMLGGCPSAGPRFEEVHARYAGTPASSEAAWQAADCYRSLGDVARARQNYQELLTDSSYKGRAESALAELDEHNSATELTPRKAAKSAPATAAAPPPTQSPAKPKAGEASP
jgi:TolA-binding protein